MMRSDWVGPMRREVEPEAGLRVGAATPGVTRDGRVGEAGLILRPGMTCSGATGRVVDGVEVVTLDRDGAVTDVRGVVNEEEGSYPCGEVDGEDREGMRRIPPRSVTERVTTGAETVRDGVRCG